MDRETVHRAVEDLVAREGLGPTAAIRRVAEDQGRTVAAVRSAYYAAKRAADGEAEPHQYAEMLPLVEAGLSPAQAARRVGADKSAEHLAEGFARWARRRGVSVPPARRAARRDAGDDAARLQALEQENADLRAALEEARHALARIADLADAARS